MNRINRKIVLSAVILLITVAVALTACRGKNKDKTSSDTRYNDIELTESLTSKEASEITSEWNGIFDSSADTAGITDKEESGNKKSESPSSSVSNQENGSKESFASENSSKENTSSDSTSSKKSSLGAEITTEPNGFVG